MSISMGLRYPFDIGSVLGLALVRIVMLTIEIDIILVRNFLSFDH